MDCVVLSWLFGTLTVELQDTVREGGGSARDAWIGIEEQFLGNRETRALYLDAEFRPFVQGDLLIRDYCRKMKGMADALGNLGEVITDRTLVLNVLRGLNAKYDHIKALLKRTRPFPTFNEVRNDLQLEELTLDPPVSQPPTALLASQPKSSATNTSQVPQPGDPSLHGASNRAPGTGPSHHGVGAGSGSNGGKRHHRRGNNGKGGNGSQGGSPWPSFYNPWTGSFTVWPTRGQQQQQPCGPPPDGRSDHPAPQQAFMAAPNPYSIPPPPGFPPMLTASLFP